MRSEFLDNLSLDEVLDRVRCDKTNREYWIRVARCKLSEYRRLMPRLSRFVPDGEPWQVKHDRWTKQLDRLCDCLAK